MDLLVSTEWLAQELGKPGLRVLDATLFLASDGRDARAEFEAGHIPGAGFMDLAEISDAGTALEFMLPRPEKFASRMQALGVGDGQRIVLYDNSPYHSSARAWWMLTVYGAHDVSILDGGLEKWKAEGRPLESGKPVVRHRHFTVWEDRSRVRTLEQMLQNLKTGAEQVVDARSPGRFTGAEPEPRPGIRPGHIPGARNLHYATLFNADGTWKSPAEIEAAFREAGVDPDRPIVASCGSGITAAVLLFGLALTGRDTAALYDGSWMEWGSHASTPAVTGAA
ncbi:MAG: 3-mercaptopyruvate sulfurtransferase [Sphingomonadaceae bacterium]